MTCPICSWSYDNVDYLFVYETTHWRIRLAPNQSLVGRCVIRLKRHTADLANLTMEEILEFLDVIKGLEDALRSAFDATMFNWSCYMNFAYQDTPPDPHVHWWAVPRFNHPVRIGDRTFEDPRFGTPYDHNRWLEVPIAVRAQIAERIQKALLRYDNERR